MAMRTPPPIMPSPEEARLLDWLRTTAQRDNIPPWTLVPALLDTLQTIDAGRGKKPLHNKLAELAAMGSPQRQTSLRIILALTALVGFIILCCLFSYVAGALIVVTNQHPLPTLTVPS